MKSKWLTLLACISVLAAALAIENCGGVGGPTSGPGGGDNPTEQFLALLSTEQKAGTYIGAEACANGTCHGGLTGDTTYAHWQQTTHANRGVTCERCHGPGSVHQANPTKDNILTFPRSTNPVVCGQCHGPTNEQYDFSKHAKLVADPIEEAITNPQVYGKSSRCIVCHSGLMRAQITEQGVNVATMDNAEIQQIGENTITEVPFTASCATCHDPHSRTGKLDQNGEEKQIRHLTFNTDTTQIGPGTTAATFTNFDHICAQCHNGRGTNPSDAALTSGTARPSMHDSNQYNMLMGIGGVEGQGAVRRNTAHATAPGQCTKCHMPDSRHTMTVSYDRSCSPCHTAADAAARATSIKSEILSGLVTLRNRMGNWAQAEFGNDLYWEYTSTITAEGGTPPNQSSVPIQVKRARHNYYFILRSGDYGVHNAPYAEYLLQVANENLDEINAPSGQRSRVEAMSTDAKLRLIEGDRKKVRKLDVEHADD